MEKLSFWGEYGIMTRVFGHIHEVKSGRDFMNMSERKEK